MLNVQALLPVDREDGVISVRCAKKARLGLEDVCLLVKFEALEQVLRLAESDLDAVQRGG